MYRIRDCTKVIKIQLYKRAVSIKKIVNLFSCIDSILAIYCQKWVLLPVASKINYL